ncbi:MAG: ATPase P [Ignavibacteria bacterium]|nr:ATPase P [Ignavibacteria bacterium]
MITIDIPGNKKIEAEHLVLDYNGTLAIDGTLIPGVREILNSLAEDLKIHIVTANTFGKTTENLVDIDCNLVIINNDFQQLQKVKYISDLGENAVIAIGNGLNDALMLKNAALGIVVIQKEGASVKSLENADIVCTNILDALELLKNPLRMAATLRN